MSNTSTVNFLIDQANNKRDAAAVRLLNAQTQCLEAENKKLLLRQYLADYQKRQRTLSHTDVVILVNLRGFMEKLEGAIEQQNALVLSARRSVIQARQNWEQAMQHCKAMEILKDRRDAVTVREAGRMQQRQQDEHAIRMSMCALALAG